MAGQKILFSGRCSVRRLANVYSGGVTKTNNGDTIKANAHAAIGTIAHLSIGVEDLG
jgi:hypothetical protein